MSHIISSMPFCSATAREPFADRIAPPEREHVVVEEEHAGDLDAVCACFELRENHLAQLVAGRAGADEHVCDPHVGTLSGFGPIRRPAINLLVLS